MIYCKNIDGKDWVFDLDYVVKSWGEPACRDYDEQPFKFEITRVKAALDVSGAIFTEADLWVIEQLEDDYQLAEEIHWDAHEWSIAEDDLRLEALESRYLGLAE